jgi:predicted DNA-binding transcriptional regulator AlpA
MSEPLLNARELAALLGLSTGTVLDRFEAGDLPGFRLYGGRVGAPVRFRWSEVEAMLEEGRCGPRVDLPPRDVQRVTASPLHSDRVEA